MEFVVTASGGESVTIESENWMMAMGKAMSSLGAEAASMGRWVCTPQGDGRVDIKDPVTDQSWEVRPADVVVEAAPLEPEPEPEPEPTEDIIDENVLAERIFDLSMDIAGADPRKAGRMALDIVLELVPCEAGSVLRGTVNDLQLTFVAATGPVGEALVGQGVPFGQGLIGLSFDMGLTIQVNNVNRDPRHFGDFDRQTGFRTNSTLCVPITNDEGSFGAIQLINPASRFETWHAEAVEQVARTLASSLAPTA